MPRSSLGDTFGAVKYQVSDVELSPLISRTAYHEYWVFAFKPLQVTDTSESFPAPVDVPMSESSAALKKLTFPVPEKPSTWTVRRGDLEAAAVPLGVGATRVGAAVMVKL